MPKVIKPSNPFTNVCWVSVLLSYFSAPPQILAASTVFFCPIRNRKMMGDVFPLVLLLPVVLNSKRLLSTSCNKQGQRSGNYLFFFMVLFPMLFEVRRIVCVEN